MQSAFYYTSPSRRRNALCWSFIFIRAALVIVRILGYKAQGYQEKNLMGKRSKTINGSGLEISEIDPLTAQQVVAFESEKNLVLYGCAGTGKTFVGCYLAYDDMAKGLYEKLIIIRSAVPTRDIGFLPGTLAEKTSIYEEPYKDIATDIFQRGDAYQILKTKNIVHFMTTSYLRGITSVSYTHLTLPTNREV